MSSGVDYIKDSGSCPIQGNLLNKRTLNSAHVTTEARTDAIGKKTFSPPHTPSISPPKSPSTNLSCGAVGFWYDPPTLGEELLTKEQQERKLDLLEKKFPISIFNANGNEAPADLPENLGEISVGAFIKAFKENLKEANLGLGGLAPVKNLRLGGSGANAILFEKPSFDVLRDYDIVCYLNPPMANMDNRYYLDRVKDVFLFTLASFVPQEYREKIEKTSTYKGMDTPYKNKLTFQLLKHYLNCQTLVSDVYRKSNWSLLGFGKCEFRFVIRDAREWSTSAYSFQVDLENGSSYCLYGNREKAEQHLKERRFVMPNAEDIPNGLARSLYELRRFDVYSWEDLLPFCENFFHLKKTVNDFVKIIEEHLSKACSEKKILQVFTLLEAVYHSTTIADREELFEKTFSLISKHLDKSKNGEIGQFEGVAKLLDWLTKKNHPYLARLVLDIVKENKNFISCCSFSSSVSKSLYSVCSFLLASKEEIFQIEGAKAFHFYYPKMIDFPQQLEGVFQEISKIIRSFPMPLTEKQELFTVLVERALISLHFKNTNDKSAFYGSIINFFIDMECYETAKEIFLLTKDVAFSKKSTEKSRIYALLIAKKTDDSLTLLEEAIKDPQFLNDKNLSLIQQTSLEILRMLFSKSTDDASMIKLGRLLEQFCVFFPSTSPLRKDYVHIYSSYLTKQMDVSDSPSSMRNLHEIDQIIKSKKVAKDILQPLVESSLKMISENKSDYSQEDLLMILKYISSLLVSGFFTENKRVKKLLKEVFILRATMDKSPESIDKLNRLLLDFAKTKALTNEELITLKLDFLEKLLTNDMENGKNLPVPTMKCFEIIKSVSSSEPSERIGMLVQNIFLCMIAMEKKKSFEGAQKLFPILEKHALLKGKENLFETYLHAYAFLDPLLDNEKNLEMHRCASELFYSLFQSSKRINFFSTTISDYSNGIVTKGFLSLFKKAGDEYFPTAEELLDLLASTPGLSIKEKETTDIYLEALSNAYNGYLSVKSPINELRIKKLLSQVPILSLNKERVLTKVFEQIAILQNVHDFAKVKELFDVCEKVTTVGSLKNAHIKQLQEIGLDFSLSITTPQQFQKYLSLFESLEKNTFFIKAGSSPIESVLGFISSSFENPHLLSSTLAFLEQLKKSSLWNSPRFIDEKRNVYFLLLELLSKYPEMRKKTFSILKESFNDPHELWKPLSEERFGFFLIHALPLMEQADSVEEFNALDCFLGQVYSYTPKKNKVQIFCFNETIVRKALEMFEKTQNETIKAGYLARSFYACVVLLRDRKLFDPKDYLPYLTRLYQSFESFFGPKDAPYQKRINSFWEILITTDLLRSLMINLYNDGIELGELSPEGISEGIIFRHPTFELMKIYIAEAELQYP